MPNSYTDVFGGGVTQTANTSYSTLNLNNGNVTLSWPVQFQNTNNVVYQIMDVNPGGLLASLTIPDATLVSVGTTMLISNVGANQFNLFNAEDGLISAIPAGAVIFFYLTNNNTPAGVFRAIPFGGGAIGVTSVNAAVPDATDNQNMTVVGGPITLAGVLNFSFLGDLRALTRFGPGTGISVRTAVGSWALRQVAPAANGNLSVVNGNGVAGNIIIDTAVTMGVAPQNPINQIVVGNISILGNSIRSSDANGDINLIPNGNGVINLDAGTYISNGEFLAFRNNGNDGQVYFSGENLPAGFDQTFYWPNVAPAIGQVLQYTGGDQLDWANVTTFFGAFSTDNAIARFNGAGGQIQDSTVIIQDNGSMQAPGEITSATGFTAGNIRIRAAIPEITTLAGDLNITANAGNIVNVIPDLKIGTNFARQSLIFQSGAFSVSLTSQAIAANVALTLPTTAGFANSVLQSNGAGVLSFTEIGVGTTGTSGVVADAATTLAGTDPNRPVVPLNMKAHPGVNKAWGTFIGATGVLQSSYNVANINRTGVGVYVITFATPFANTNYTPIITVGGISSFVRYTARLVNSITIEAYAQNGATAVDPTTVSFAINGLQ